MSVKSRERRKQKKARSLAGEMSTRFHIIPKAVGGIDADVNISYVPWDKHKLYHSLFGLKTPDEVIKDLVVNYWKGDWSWIGRAV